MKVLDATVAAVLVTPASGVATGSGVGGASGSGASRVPAALLPLLPPPWRDRAMTRSVFAEPSNGSAIMRNLRSMSSSVGVR